MEKKGTEVNMENKKYYKIDIFGKLSYDYGLPQLLIEENHKLDGKIILEHKSVAKYIEPKDMLHIIDNLDNKPLFKFTIFKHIEEYIHAYHRYDEGVYLNDSLYSICPVKGESHNIKFT